MADIKTHLRELSVAVTIGLLAHNIKFKVEDLFDAKKFFAYATNLIDGDISSARNITEKNIFDHDLKQIVYNGFSLGKAIYENKNFAIDNHSLIKWQGNDTQKDNPIDISIGKRKLQK